MKNSNLPGLTPAWLISLALVLGTTIVVLQPVSIASGDPIKSSDWIGFAGNVVAGTMTLIAAIIAWFAVQRQIETQEKASAQLENKLKLEQEAKYRDAKDCALAVITGPVGAAAIFLRTVNGALAETDSSTDEAWDSKVAAAKPHVR